MNMKQLILLKKIYESNNAGELLYVITNMK